MKITFFFTIAMLLAVLSQAQPITPIIVLGADEQTEVKGELLGEVKFSDKGFKSNCSYNEVIAGLKKQAEKKGGNLLKITEHKKPDAWSTCDRIKAEIYKVADISAYEQEIYWTADRKLKWEDFKSPASAMTGAAAHTYCGFGFETNRVTAFKKSKFFVHTKFYCDKSWVGKEYISQENLLSHEQAHFDLCEVYARRLYKRLTEANVNIATLQEANNIYTEVANDYTAAQQQYDEETNHGTEPGLQKKWQERVAKELEDLSAYANHN